ncbi:MAG: efflux RND transporter permease subunit [Limnochordia bacterium]|jgi:multidrug efflux pump subunit AcrB|nr:efflux RND transporter permease subunit [Limnochordia bacterium]MDD4517169.1 efflux RND transporter permease subunit [Limnochordia bacterium]
MLSEFSIRKPYTVVIGVIIVIILGIVSLSDMTTDLLPNINLPYAVVVTTYPGASPEEVETRLSRPIEQSMLSLSNIKNVSSVSSENVSIVILEFNASANMDSAMIEMRESLDMMSTFLPSSVQSPMILKLNPNMMPVMVLSAALEDKPLSSSSQFLTNVVIPELESIEGVASVSATGLIDKEIHIVLKDEKIEDAKAKLQAKLFSSMMVPGMDPSALLQDNDSAQFAQFELTKEMISGILQGQNFNMPAGYLLEGGTAYLVRVGDGINSLEQLEQLPILSLPFVGSLTLSDVAEIQLQDSTDTTYSRVNGHDSIILTIQKQTEYSTADVAGRIRERMDQLMDMHQDLEMTALMDQGHYIDVVVNSVTSNMLIGALLAILILFIFLRDIKPTLIVGLAIPISLISTFIMMYFGKVSLNIVSLGGLALGVGMLVDNSIVVIENIYRMRQEGKSARDAAVMGAQEISGAITASTLTTIAVFVPILFLHGLTRQIFADMGLTIAFSLTASLLVALTLVPMIASRTLAKQQPRKRGLLESVQAGYTRILELSLSKKWIVFALVLVLFVGSIIGAFRMGTELFPTADTEQLMIQAAMPKGISFTDATEIADELVDTIKHIDGVETVGAFFGGSMMGMGMGGAGNHETLSIYILLDENRTTSSSRIAQLIRENTKTSPAEVSVNESNMDMAALSGGAIALTVMGRDFGTLEPIAQDVAKLLAEIDGIIEISDGIEKTSPEIRIRVDKEKSIAQGLTAAQVFMQLNKILSAANADTVLNIGPDQYDVFITDERSSLDLTRDELASVTVTTPQGKTLRIGEIADVNEASGYASISRKNQQRYLSVTAAVDEGYNIGLISREIRSKLANYKVPEGYSIEFGGEQQMITDSFRDLFLMLVLAVIFIYLVMVAQFQSLLSPFIVMFTIPLAFTGGFLGLIITGKPVSIVGFLGLIILSGIVVNNGIVFVDYINVLRSRGMGKKEAIIEAGIVRLRPILMTALTTILALSTLFFGVGAGTEMIQPMAITAVGGLVYATLLTLVFVPVLYDVFHKEKTRV